MTSKRTTQSDPMSAGAAQTAATRKPRRAGAMHSPKPVAPVAPSSEAVPVDTEAVARLAYSYWEARGYTGGSSEEDWLRAEQELLLVT